MAAEEYNDRLDALPINTSQLISSEDVRNHLIAMRPELVGFQRTSATPVSFAFTATPQLLTGVPDTKEFALLPSTMLTVVEDTGQITGEIQLSEPVYDNVIVRVSAAVYIDGVPTSTFLSAGFYVNDVPVGNATTVGGQGPTNVTSIRSAFDVQLPKNAKIGFKFSMSAPGTYDVNNFFASVERIPLSGVNNP